MLPSDTNLSPFFPSFPCEGPQPHPRGFPVTLVLDEGQLVLDLWGGQGFLLLINHVHAKEPTPVQHNCMNGCHSLWFCEWKLYYYQRWIQDHHTEVLPPSPLSEFLGVCFWKFNSITCIYFICSQHAMYAKCISLCNLTTKHGVYVKVHNNNPQIPRILRDLSP